MELILIACGAGILYVIGAWLARNDPNNRTHYYLKDVK